MVCEGGVITCFAYGQTGSGKTYTMQGMTDSLIHDLFTLLNSSYASDGLECYISYFEIYGNRCYDLLNRKKRLIIREDHE